MAWSLPTGNLGVLWRSTESINATIRSMCNHIFREHVVTQCGNSGYDDAGSNRNPTPATTSGGAARINEQV